MAEDDENTELRLDWSDAESMAVQLANIFIVQAGPDSHVLNLGFVAPPLEDGQDTVRVHVVARVLLTPETAATLVNGLAENLRRREERRREQGAGNDD